MLLDAELCNARVERDGQQADHEVRLTNHVLDRGLVCYVDEHRGRVLVSTGEALCLGQRIAGYRSIHEYLHLRYPNWRLTNDEFNIIPLTDLRDGWASYHATTKHQNPLFPRLRFGPPTAAHPPGIDLLSEPGVFLCQSAISSHGGPIQGTLQFTLIRTLVVGDE
jgi:hypothetical protein